MYLISRRLQIFSAQARVAEAHEVSDVILFLASDEASDMTGTTVPVDGGFVAANRLRVSSRDHYL